MDKLFEQFLREKKYLQNLSWRTLDIYGRSFKEYKRVINSDELPTPDTLKEFVIGLKERGLKATAINCYARSINAFLSWLHANKHTPEKLVIKKLKEEKDLIRPFADDQIRKLLSFKPVNFGGRRLYALLCFAIDTGHRRLAEWAETDVLLNLWRAFLNQLSDQQKVRWNECFIDGMFIRAKKGPAGRED
jgi:site-specific recombinase XerD